MESRTILSCPYVGLTPYTEEQAAYFFGREREIRLVASKLCAARLTLFYGASGVGKSSVLRAGVARTLRQDDGVAVVVFDSWQGDPVAGLVEAIGKEVVRILAAQGEEDKRPSMKAASLGDCLRAAAEIVGPVRLILDQFEEYFMYHPSDDGPGSFAVELAKAVNRDDVQASFLISIREDAYTKLDLFKGRILNLFANYVHMDHLDAVAARAAITKPLAQYNLEFHIQPPFEAEPALVEEIVKQVGVGKVSVGAAGAGQVSDQTERLNAVMSVPSEAPIETPYLQLVLTRLWDEETRSGSHILRHQTLQDLGEAESIVRTHLDAALDALPGDEQNMAAKAFYYLVTPSSTKIAHSISDLADYTKLSEAQLAPVLARLAQKDIRILRPVATPPGQPETPRYEIFHDVLARAVVTWRRRYEEQQAKERIRQEERERLERERAEAERQRQLTQAMALADEQRLRAEAERQRAEEQARAARLRGWSLVAVTILSVLALVAASIAAWQGGQASRNANLAATREVEALANANLAATREVEALTNANLAATRAALAESSRVTVQAEAIRAADGSQVAQDALATQVALAEQVKQLRAKQADLQHQIQELQQPTVAPTQTPVAVGTPRPTPTLTPMPTADLAATASAQALATQLDQIQATQTAIAACPTVADEQLLGAYDRATLGCPRAEATIVWSSWQPFERGNMLWRSDTGGIMVFCSAVITWTQVLDRWDQVSPISYKPDRSDPPPGMLRPESGFGYLWGADDDIFGCLGWALETEKGFCAKIQNFDRGTVLRSITAVESCQGNPNRARDPDFEQFMISAFYDGNYTRY